MPAAIPPFLPFLRLLLLLLHLLISPSSIIVVVARPIVADPSQTALTTPADCSKVDAVADANHHSFLWSIQPSAGGNESYIYGILSMPKNLVPLPNYVKTTLMHSVDKVVIDKPLLTSDCKARLNEIQGPTAKLPTALYNRVNNYFVRLKQKQLTEKERHIYNQLLKFKSLDDEPAQWLYESLGFIYTQWELFLRLNGSDMGVVELLASMAKEQLKPVEERLRKPFCDVVPLEAYDIHFAIEHLLNVLEAIEQGHEPAIGPNQRDILAYGCGRMMGEENILGIGGDGGGKHDQIYEEQLKRINHVLNKNIYWQQNDAFATAIQQKMEENSGKKLLIVIPVGHLLMRNAGASGETGGGAATVVELLRQRGFRLTEMDVPQLPENIVAKDQSDRSMGVTPPPLPTNDDEDEKVEKGKWPGTTTTIAAATTGIAIAGGGDGANVAKGEVGGMHVDVEPIPIVGGSGSNLPTGEKTAEKSGIRLWMMFVAIVVLLLLFICCTAALHCFKPRNRKSFHPAPVEVPLQEQPPKKNVNPVDATDLVNAESFNDATVQNLWIDNNGGHTVEQQLHHQSSPSTASASKSSNSSRSGQQPSQYKPPSNDHDDNEILELQTTTIACTRSEPSSPISSRTYQKQPAYPLPHPQQQPHNQPMKTTSWGWGRKSKHHRPTLPPMYFTPVMNEIDEEDEDQMPLPPPNVHQNELVLGIPYQSSAMTTALQMHCATLPVVHNHPLTSNADAEDNNAAVSSTIITTTTLRIHQIEVNPDPQQQQMPQINVKQEEKKQHSEEGEGGPGESGGSAVVQQQMQSSASNTFGNAEVDASQPTAENINNNKNDTQMASSSDVSSDNFSAPADEQSDEVQQQSPTAENNYKPQPITLVVVTDETANNGGTNDGIEANAGTVPLDPFVPAAIEEQQEVCHTTNIQEHEEEEQNNEEGVIVGQADENTMLQKLMKNTDDDQLHVEPEIEGNNDGIGQQQQQDVPPSFDDRVEVQEQNQQFEEEKHAKENAKMEEEEDGGKQAMMEEKEQEENKHIDVGDGNEGGGMASQESDNKTADQMEMRSNEKQQADDQQPMEGEMTEHNDGSSSENVVCSKHESDLAPANFLSAYPDPDYHHMHIKSSTNTPPGSTASATPPPLPVSAPPTFQGRFQEEVEKSEPTVAIGKEEHSDNLEEEMTPQPQQQTTEEEVEKPEEEEDKRSNGTQYYDAQTGGGGSGADEQQQQQQLQ